MRQAEAAHQQRAVVERHRVGGLGHGECVVVLVRVSLERLWVLWL
jgi:hypothetical protein